MVDRKTLPMLLSRQTPLAEGNTTQIHRQHELVQVTTPRS